MQCEEAIQRAAALGDQQLAEFIQTTYYEKEKYKLQCELAYDVAKMHSANPSEFPDPSSFSEMLTNQWAMQVKTQQQEGGGGRSGGGRGGGGRGGGGHRGRRGGRRSGGGAVEAGAAQQQGSEEAGAAQQEAERVAEQEAAERVAEQEAAERVAEQEDAVEEDAVVAGVVEEGAVEGVEEDAVEEGAAQQEGDAVAQGGEALWQEQMLRQIAGGGMPAIDHTQPHVPKSARNQFKQSAQNSILVHLNADTYAKLHVPIDQHARAVKLIRRMVANVDEAMEGTATWMKQLSPPSVSGVAASTTKTWHLILTPEQHNALQTAARTTTIAELNSQMELSNRARNEEQVKAEVLRALKELGIHTCATCTNPILDPDDEDFDKKRELVVNVAKPGAQMQTCSCGHSHVVCPPEEVDSPPRMRGAARGGRKRGRQDAGPSAARARPAIPTATVPTAPAEGTRRDASSRTPRTPPRVLPPESPPAEPLSPVDRDPAEGTAARAYPIESIAPVEGDAARLARIVEIATTRPHWDEEVVHALVEVDALPPLHQIHKLVQKVHYREAQCTFVDQHGHLIPDVWFPFGVLLNTYPEQAKHAKRTLPTL